MATITLNVDDEDLEVFREAVKEEKGEGKGKLGKSASEALRKWAEEVSQKRIAQRQISLLKKGFHMGKMIKWNREELYERGI